METIHQNQHRGPHLGMLAIIFALLFITGLSFVVSFSATAAHFPPPWEPVATIAAYFKSYPHDVLMCSFFQFCSAIPLGLFTVTAFSRMQFLGIRAAGPAIALFGGLLTAATIIISSSVGWAMIHPAISSDASIITALYYLSFALGGVGYSVPLGLLIAGLAVSAGFTKLLPRWLVWSGVLLAVIGELSCLTLVFPNVLPLIPLTRFPGFIWLIFVGFKLPRKI